MRNLKTLYVRNVLEDLIKKKSGGRKLYRDLRSPVRNARNRPGGKAVTETEEQKQEIEEYNAKIAEYDSAIEDSRMRSRRRISRSRACRNISITRFTCRSTRIISRRYRCSMDLRPAIMWEIF